LLLRCPILMIQQTILLIVSSKCILKEFKAAFLTPINLLQPPAIVSPPLKQTGDSPTSVIFENCSYLTTVTTNPSWRMNLPPSPSLSGSWRTLMDNCGNNALCTLIEFLSADSGHFILDSYTLGGCFMVKLWKEIVYICTHNWSSCLRLERCGEIIPCNAQSIHISYGVIEFMIIPNLESRRDHDCQPACCNT
jgi:hypothetical protein